MHAPRGVAQRGFTARYHSEKHVYLVGEPIIIDFEATNHTKRVGLIGDSGCDIGPFETHGAVRKKKSELFGCGPHPAVMDCLIGTMEIPPGRKYVKRLFLNGPFVLDSPGTYQVQTARYSQCRGLIVPFCSPAAGSARAAAGVSQLNLNSEVEGRFLRSETARSAVPAV